MDRKLTVGTLAIAAAMVCGPAFAQMSAPPAEAPQEDAAAPNATAPESAGASTADAQDPSQVLASELIGMRVKNGADDDAAEIGKISDIVLDENQKAVNVVIGVGGFLGIGSKHVGVPLDEVQFNADDQVAVVNMSKDELESAPEYTTVKMKQAEQGKAMQQQQAPVSSGAAGGRTGGGIGGGR